MLRRLFVALTLAAVGASPLPAQDAPKSAPLTKVPEGRYTLTYGSASGPIQFLAIVQLDHLDGKDTAELVSLAPAMADSGLKYLSTDVYRSR